MSKVVKKTVSTAGVKKVVKKEVTLDELKELLLAATATIEELKSELSSLREDVVTLSNAVLSGGEEVEEGEEGEGGDEDEVGEVDVEDLDVGDVELGDDAEEPEEEIVDVVPVKKAVAKKAPPKKK